MSSLKVVGVIPARFGSTRFPGKMLAPILGKSLLQRTYENALRSRSLHCLIVATDDERIFEHVKSFGGEVVMTSPSCPTGTDRVAEVVRTQNFEADIIVNIQGDEPLLSPYVIDQLISDIQSCQDAVLTTPVTLIKNEQDVLRPSIVKCIFDENRRALYFSRAPIPYPQKGSQGLCYYRHLGVYCFRKEFLLKYCEIAPTRLQKIEDLEQLKVLEKGFPIHVSLIENEEGIGVDIPEDIKKIEEILCRENTFLSQEELSLL